MKLFVRHSHAQADWVRERLVPCLKAGGAEVLIDHGRFVAGPPVVDRCTRCRIRPSGTCWCRRRRISPGPGRCTR